DRLEPARGAPALRRAAGAADDDLRERAQPATARVADRRPRRGQPLLAATAALPVRADERRARARRATATARRMGLAAHRAACPGTAALRLRHAARAALVLPGLRRARRGAARRRRGGGAGIRVARERLPAPVAPSRPAPVAPSALRPPPSALRSPLSEACSGPA